MLRIHWAHNKGGKGGWRQFINLTHVFLYTMGCQPFRITDINNPEQPITMSKGILHDSTIVCHSSNHFGGEGFPHKTFLYLCFCLWSSLWFKVMDPYLRSGFRDKISKSDDSRGFVCLCCQAGVNQNLSNHTHTVLRWEYLLFFVITDLPIIVF